MTESWQKSEGALRREKLSMDEFRRRVQAHRRTDLPGMPRKRAAQTLSEAAKALSNERECHARAVRLLVPLDRTLVLTQLAERAMRSAWKRSIPLTVEVDREGTIRYAVSGVCGNPEVEPLSRAERALLLQLIRQEGDRLGATIQKTPIDGLLQVVVDEAAL